jgi:hypothetical protein
MPRYRHIQGPLLGILSLSAVLLGACDGELPTKENASSKDNEPTSTTSEVGEDLGTEVGGVSKGGVFSAPNYDVDGDGEFELKADGIKDLAGNVAMRQSGGLLSGIGSILGGTMTLGTGQKVAVSADFAPVKCPKDVDDCDTVDSAKLGIGSGALVAPLKFLQRRIGVQGERATCAAFVVNDAVEILLERDDVEVDLSEQNTYFVGKRATNTWNSEGVVPGAFLRGLVAEEEGLVAESAWPYNIDRGDCAAYNKKHDGFTCSKTEAQGGGDDHKLQEPKAAEAKTQYVIEEAHQLYAAVGRVKQALHQGYPVLLSFQANKDFQAATKREGVVAWNAKEVTCGNQSCGHAVLAVGYLDDKDVQGGGYIIIKNSWDKTWGKDGFGFLTYEWLTNSIIDAQAIVKAGKR